MNRAAVLQRGLGVGASCVVFLGVLLLVAAGRLPLGLLALLAVGLLAAAATFAVRRPVLAPAAAAALLVAGDVAVPLVEHLAKLTSVLAAVLVLFARMAGRGRRIGWSPLLATLALLITCAFLSTATSLDPARSLFQDADYLVGLALAASVVAATVDRTDLLLLATVITLSGAVLCVSALTSAADLEARNNATVVSNRPIGVFAQPNELGLAAAMTLCFSIAITVLAFRQRRRTTGALCAATAALALVALLLSLSRGAWIGATLGLVVLAALLREARRPLLTGLAALVTVAVVQLVVLRTTANVVTQRLLTLFNGQRNPYDVRPEVWAEALDQLGRRPLLGSGPRAFPAAARANLANFTAARDADHAHNLLLTVGAEQGVLGAAGLIAAVSVGAWEALRNARPPKRGPTDGSSPGPATDLVVRGVSAGAAAALAAVIGQGIVDYPLRNPITDALTWLVIGLLAACARTRSGRPAPEIPRFAP
ncbi:O-antigen ligase family protein [Kitasatospora sp. NPDC127111]|uniref:O-antigen ligase family protein n=1 Tax=Kitasatospora sp. NPDC127111 TaxID=3345363 RepID=UPI00363AD09E